MPQGNALRAYEGQGGGSVRAKSENLFKVCLRVRKARPQGGLRRCQSFLLDGQQLNSQAHLRFAPCSPSRFSLSPSRPDAEQVLMNRWMNAASSALPA